MKVSKWITEVLEYRPAPGQFINEIAGSENSPQNIIGNKKGILTLGGFGGYVIFRFKDSVVNQEGNDFVILGNAFEGSSEPGIVMVSEDVNGDGIANDKWYELKGAVAESEITLNYEITYQKPSQTETAKNIQWTDNNGGSGEISVVLGGNQQCYYPLFVDTEEISITFTGSHISFDIVDNDGIYSIPDLGKGYADNFSEEYDDIVNGDINTQKSNKFDISNAVDESRASVNLEKIHFVKVYNCINDITTTLGEVSTEIMGAISLTADK